MLAALKHIMLEWCLLRNVELSVLMLKKFQSSWSWKLY